MEIVYFIGTRQLDNFSFGRVVKRDRYKFIAIISEEDLPKLSPQVKANFDEVHTVMSSGDRVLSELNIDQIYPLIESDIKSYPLSEIAIVCQDEANVLIAGILRDRFNVKSGAKASELGVFRDKVLMKERLNQSGIRVPRYISFGTDNYSYAAITEQIGTPFIVKPRSSAGTFGVYKISNSNDYNIFINNYKDKLDLYEGEEFIVGDIFTFDTVAKKGNLLFLECSKYSCPTLDFQNGSTCAVIALSHDDNRYTLLSEFGKKVLFSLGIPDGCHHMELFITQNNEVIFMEVGARAPGFMLARVYEKTYGKNVLDLDLSLQANISMRSNNFKLSPSFFAMFPIHEGKIKKLIKPNLQSEYELKWTVKEGQTTPACLSNIDIGGIIFVHNENYEVLKADYYNVANHKAIIY